MLGGPLQSAMGNHNQKKEVKHTGVTRNDAGYQFYSPVLLEGSGDSVTSHNSAYRSTHNWGSKPTRLARGTMTGVLIPCTSSY